MSEQQQLKKESTKTLTPELAAKYWGCKMRIKIDCFSEWETMELDAHNIIFLVSPIHAAEMFLKPLSAMTEEDLVQFRRLNDQFQITEEEDTDMTNMVACVDFLRSKGYDLDNGLAEGWAIDETKLESDV